ncbi:MAG: SMP-30/gluconolactonase/LRE family protein [bacterium]|nr:SMP-30/gluconolactonase/LRE family protein [bacterium]
MKDDGGPPTRQGQFYRYDRDGRVTAHFDKLFTSNGTAFSPDGQTMYLSDSYPDIRPISACDYDLETGAPSRQRVFFDTRQVAGRPDGGTVDSDGCYRMAWCRRVAGRALRQRNGWTRSSRCRSKGRQSRCSAAPISTSFSSHRSVPAPRTIRANQTLAVCL